MSLTSDPNDPELNRGTPGQQNEVYLVLSDEELSKGFVRPVRTSYVHTKCLAVTTMNVVIAETYARQPKFYGATFCTKCRDHFPVAEFTWTRDGEVVGS